MGYRALADAAMLLHFAVLAYLVAGGFLAWRWRWAIWPHAAMVAWGGAIVVFGLDCPLTYVEDWGRRRAGGQQLAGGFIDHYLTGVIYPGDAVNLVRLLVAVVVAVSWIGAFVVWRRHGAGVRAAASGRDGRPLSTRDGRV